LREFAAADPAASEGAVVFVGASNIERLDVAQLFPGKPTVNRGIASATADELTAFVPELALPAHPAGVVIHAGANDWRGLGLPADSIAPRVERLLNALAERAHPAPILLLGLLPERGASPELVRDRAAIDEALSAVAARARAAGHRVTFLRLARPPISSADGTLAEEFSSDREHLNAAGAQQLARWIASEGGAAGRFLAP
jgi:lysophospholipase L1-like esterase